MSNNSSTRELASALGETSQTITIGGQTVIVRELTITDLLDFLPRLDAAKISATDVVELINPATGNTDQYFQQSWIKLMTTAAPVVFDLLSRLTGQDEAFLRGLGVGAMARLFRVVVEVNSSFFGEIQAITGALAKAGLAVTPAQSSALPAGARSPQHLDAADIRFQKSA